MPSGVWYRKVGTDVELNILCAEQKMIISKEWLSLGTLPEEYRSKKGFVSVCSIETDAELVLATLTLNDTGLVNVRQITGTAQKGLIKGFLKYSIL